MENKKKFLILSYVYYKGAMMRILLVCAIALVLISNIDVFAQANGGKTVQVLVKGKVTDEFTGKPVEVTLELRDRADKRFKINSNSITGMYEQVLTAGEVYTVVFTHYDVIRKTEEFKVKESDTYIEDRIDFTVKQLQTGLELYQVDAFQQNSSVPNAEFAKTIQELAEIMKFNRSVKFEFVVNSHDSYSEPRTYQTEVEVPQTGKKKKAPKKEIQTVTDPAPDPASVKALVDERNSILEKSLEPLQAFKNRITIKPDYNLAPPPEQAGMLHINPDFKVIVTEIKNVFK